METKDLKKKFKDLTVAKLTMDAVYSRRAIEEMITKQFGNSVLRYEYYGKKVNVATSSTYGKFVEQLKPGAKVVMTGGEIELNPAYKNKVWTVTSLPELMCGEVVVWLYGFRGAYSANMLRFPTPDEDLSF
jgi:hypothetical protein